MFHTDCVPTTWQRPCDSDTRKKIIAVGYAPWKEYAYTTWPKERSSVEKNYCTKITRIKVYCARKSANREKGWHEEKYLPKLNCTGVSDAVRENGKKKPILYDKS